MSEEKDKADERQELRIEISGIVGGPCAALEVTHQIGVEVARCLGFEPGTLAIESRIEAMPKP
ncbi:MAG: hypothetical protein GY832_01450 [Chloroflexi bacterium]|nr:hypothetical protein [Chloroflexota bacterium]